MNRLLKLLFASLMLTFSQGAFAQAGNWVVSEAAGKVVIRDAGGDKAAKRGTIVSPGATLSTGPASRAIVVRGKDFVTVSAGSRIRIPTPQQGRSDVIQEWGNAVFQIEKKPNPHFGVRTPYLAAVVKGTTFSITVTAEGASLQVLEGAVETSTVDGGASELIRPGILATVNASDRFRLTVQGQDTRTIDSPQRSQMPPTGGPDAEQAVPNSGETGSDDQASEIIEMSIAANPVDLGKATDGLVGGTVQVASADAALARSGNAGSGTNGNEQVNGRGSDQGTGNGNGSANVAGSTSNGNGSGNGSAGNGNGNGSGASDLGTGNGNGSGSGNGNGAGTSDPGTGNGNGNGSGNGNGNGSGASDPGTGNGNGNGSGNGNGNGSGASDPGTGTGNGNGSGNGNGNGSANDPGTGTGNGNGNGNGNGSGASDPGTGNGNGKDDGGKGKGNDKP